MFDSSINITEGKIAWTVDAPFCGAPFVPDERGGLVIASDGGDVSSLRSDGSQRWTVYLNAQISQPPMILPNGTILVGTDIFGDQGLYAIGSEGGFYGDSPD